MDSHEIIASKPNGSIISHGYGRSFISDVIKGNAERFIQDVGRVRFVVGPEAYADQPFVTELKDVPKSGFIVLYDEEGFPDFLLPSFALHLKGKVTFRGKLILPEYQKAFDISEW